MSEKEKKIPIPKIFTEGQYTTQAEMLPVKPKKNKLFIGIPKELTMQENRVALVPTSVATLIGHGHRYGDHAKTAGKDRRTGWPQTKGRHERANGNENDCP